MVQVSFEGSRTNNFFFSIFAYVLVRSGVYRGCQPAPGSQIRNYPVIIVSYNIPHDPLIMIFLLIVVFAM